MAQLLAPNDENRLRAQPPCDPTPEGFFPMYRFSRKQVWTFANHDLILLGLSLSPIHLEEVTQGAYKILRQTEFVTNMFIKELSHSSGITRLRLVFPNTGRLGVIILIHRTHLRKAAYTALGSIVTAALLITPLTPAAAQETSPHETVINAEIDGDLLLPASELDRELADLVGDHSPVTTSDEQHLVPKIDGADSDLVLDEVRGGVVLSADGAGSVTHLATGLEIGFPKQATDAEAAVTTNGSIVYADDDDTALVVQNDANTTAIHTIINDSTASKEYSYPVRNGTPRIRVDGAVDIYQTVTTRGADGELANYTDVAATMAAPWAKDANGKSIETHYEVRGSSVVQFVDFDESTAFPVIADPSTAWGWIVCGAVAVGAAIALFNGGAKVVQLLRKADKLKEAVSKAQKVWKKYKITKGMSKKQIAKAKNNRKKALTASLGSALAIVLGADDVWAACSG